MKIEADFPQPTPTEIVEQIRTPDLFIDTVQPKPGQKIWVFDLNKRTIREAEYEDQVNADFKGNPKKKLIVPKGCLVVIAINKKNAMKKLMKSV